MCAGKQFAEKEKSNILSVYLFIAMLEAIKNCHDLM